MIGREGFRGANQNTECLHDSQWEAYRLKQYLSISPFFVLYFSRYAICHFSFHRAFNLIGRHRYR